jgi:hypothetical protein
MSIDQAMREIFLWSKLTAISGLSATTYSCGGDGSRFGGGVSDSFLKYFAIPVGRSIAIVASSSVGGADDNDESSESEGMVEMMG